MGYGIIALRGGSWAGFSNQIMMFARGWGTNNETRRNCTCNSSLHTDSQSCSPCKQVSLLEMCRPIAHQRVQLHITRDRSLSPDISGILIQLKRCACPVSRIFSLLAYLVTRLTASQQAMQCLVEALSDLSQIPCRQQA